MNLDQILIGFYDIFLRFKGTMVRLLPDIIGALFILLAGFLLAFLVRMLIRRLIVNAGRFIPNLKIRSFLEPARMKEPARLISNILYWIVIIFFITVATETVGLPIITTWLSGVVNYLPKVFIATLIIISGFIGATVVENLMQSAAQSAGVEQYTFIGKFGRYLVWLLTILIGVDQLGIEITSLIQMILIILAALLLGAALAFGFGAKNFVSDILASNYLQRIYRVGDQIKIGDISGRILRFTPLAVIVDSTDGQVYIPSKKFSELTSTLIGKME